jgi:prepilin-type N-terminal cleavage/methylation domain-containing protein
MTALGRNRRRRAFRPSRLRSRAGFSLLELVVAMIVLTVGLLGLAAVTGWVIRNVETARVETARAAALQSAVEGMRAMPFESYADGSTTVGDYTVSWSELGSDGQSRVVNLVLQGPGQVPGSGGFPQIRPDVSDTLRYRVIRR